MEIFICLLDEHFVRHFESHWRETWRNPGRWNIPQISLETPSPPPPPLGSCYLGEPVIEFQRYASNANYTLNLLHSIHGVDYFLNFKFNLIDYSKPFRWIEQMEQQYLKTVIWLSWTIVGFTTDISLQSPYYETFYKNIVLISCSNLLTRPS